MTSDLTRRDMMKGAALSLGAAALIKTSLLPEAAMAQFDNMGPGDVVSFARGGVTFHTYVSPAPAVSVTSHVVEFENELMLADATMLPPTAMEVQALIASTGKPVSKAVISHFHPDHWGAAMAYQGTTFSTLPAIADGIPEQAGGPFQPPANVMGDLDLGATTMGGVTVEFRNVQNAESPDAVVVVFPDQKVAIVQDLVYNGVFFAPGVDRQNWISVLEGLRDDPSFDILLVGHGVPTTRGELDTAIAYLKTFDEVMNTAADPDAAMAAMKAAYPGYSGDFLLSLIAEYWSR